VRSATASPCRADVQPVALPFSDTFGKHLDAGFLARVTSLRTTARTIGTDVHDAVHTAFHAESLGKTSIEDVARSIDANKAQLLPEAKKLGI